jgi:hypothetical protein
MTALLEKVIAEISKLPVERQEEVASWMLSELESENRWTAAFSSSQSALEAMAAVALSEHQAGLTKELDPDKL